MTKYSFLVYHQAYTGFLDGIQDLGVLHLVEKEKDVSDSTLEKYGELKEIVEVIKFLSARLVEKPNISSITIDGKQALEEVLLLQQELENKNQQLAILQKEMNYAAPWGDFSIETINKLKDNGFSVRFFTVSARKYDPEWENIYPIKVVGEQGGLYYVIAIAPSSEKLELDMESMRQPERPISELEFFKVKINEDIETFKKELDRHAKDSVEAITKVYLEKKENIHYEKALFNTTKEADEKLMLLEGWVPNENKEALTTYLDQNNILFLEAKPEGEDKVPIKLKNNWFSKLFEPIGDFYELPKHTELDLVPFFAPFYMMFFGFCLGDAGYGLFIVAMAAIFKPKFPKFKSILTLAQVLGLATVFFGILTGTFFGINLIEAEIPFLEGVKQYMINPEQMFNLAVILGVIQILFGMVIKVWNISRMRGFKYALSTFGWLLLLIGGGSLFGLNKAGVLDAPTFKSLLYIVLGISGVFILFLNNPKGSLLSNFGAGIWDAYGMITGLLGDLLSYLRLFALGVSSAILGMVFNSMAMNMKPDVIILGPIVMIIILIFGHGITLFMATLGAFVHPIRLTFVEFYKNAGFTGGGKKYEPFRKLS